jgi:hypothetical protein
LASLSNCGIISADRGARATPGRWSERVSRNLFFVGSGLDT